MFRSRPCASLPEAGRPASTGIEGDMTMKFASNLLMVLLYTQGLLGFAGLTTVVVKDWAHAEPTFVHGAAG